MKRFATLIAAIALCAAAWGQNSLEALKERMLLTRVSLDYSYVIDGKVPVKGTGTLLLQGRCYHLTGNGLDIRSDGTTRWTVDSESKEVYIESAEDTEVEFFFTDPEKMLAGVSDLDITSDSVSGVYSDPGNGSKIRFSLSKMKSSEIKETPEEFRFDLAVTDSTWTVTDLR